MAIKEKPLVYIVILNLNGKKVLLETLASIKNIEYPNAKILVVDNGSSDGSLVAVQTSYPEFETIQTGENLGFGGGNNVGIQYACRQNADYILLLNNDTEVAPDFLSFMVETMESDSTIGILGPKIYFYKEPNKIWFAGGKINFWLGLSFHIGIRRLDHGQYDRMIDVDYISGCTFLIRRKVIEITGMFDELFNPAYAEDSDWCLRAKKKSFRIVYEPRAKVWHKISSFSGGGLTPLKTYLKIRNSYRLFKRHAKWYHWPTIIISISIGSCVFIIIQLAKGKFTLVKALFFGYVDTLTNKKRDNYHFLQI